MADDPLTIPKCQRLGDICPIPLNPTGKPDKTYKTVQLFSLEHPIPAVPTNKYRSEVLQITDGIMKELRPGRMLLIETVPPFKALIHVGLSKFHDEAELLRSWWGLYRLHGQIVASMTVELYIPSTEQAYEYILYDGTLSRKEGAALVNHMIHNNALHLMIEKSS